MAEISNAELATLENILVAIRIAISRFGEQSKEVQQILEKISDAEQLISKKLDNKHSLSNNK